MSLNAALSIAGSGLANINAQLALVSHNIANASTPSYAVESSAPESLTAGGVGMGVLTEPAQRSVDQQLQGDLYQQNATVAGLQTTQASLQAIDAVQGTPGQGQDLASLLGNVEDQFSTLLSAPDNATQQSQVAATASTLAQGINTLSNTYTVQRQDAQDNISAELQTLNGALGTIGQLSDQIMKLQATGQSTADLMNQRDAQVATISQLLSVKVLDQPNGDILITTASGTPLPTRGPADQLSTSDATLQPGSYYPGGGVPPITLGGVDVTSQLQGGEIGANITLRDSTLPGYQAQLDEFSQNLASGFAAQGLPLFTNAAGTIPASTGPQVQSGYVGFAGNIQVNPAVLANPAAVRDGLPSLNNGGLAGFSTVIANVLDNVLGTAPLASTNTQNLGPNGTLDAPYPAPATLSDFAATLVGTQATDGASATNQLSTEQAVQSTLQTNLSSETGVNLDTEMSNMIALQNAYGANAKIIAAVQSMFGELLSMVTTP